MTGFVDRSTRGKIRLRGSEAAEFLQGQVTNDVEGLEPGQGCYAALLDHKGKLRLDMRVLRAADWIWIDTEPGVENVLLRTIETYSLGREVSWEVADEQIVSLIGPDARAALEVSPPAREHAWVEGEQGLYVTTDLGVDVIGHGVELPVEPLDEEVAECLRIESGRPRYGLDMGDDTLTQEAGINERAVSFTKGCYVGQETVARLHYKGKPNRHLRGLRLSEPAAHGAPILLGEREVGRLGSACVSPSLGPIGLALVRREAAPGDEVSVAGAPARLVELPFTQE